MCNPRRVTVTVTEEVREEIRREVTRTATARDRVAGEHRVRIPVGERLSERMRAALGAVLAGGPPGWTADGAAFRCAVRGGYVVYDPAAGVLDVVAVREADVSAEGQARRELTAEFRETVQIEGEGWHYDDDWGGKTADDAKREADAAARRQLADQARRGAEAAAAAAEQAASGSVEEDARVAARAELDRVATAERERLRREAAEAAELVAARAQQAFGGLLALAARESILRYAREAGAEVVSDRETDGQIDLELRLRG